MVMKHGMLVCGHCESMVCVTDDGYRCVGCGRDIYVSLIAAHRAELERIRAAQEDVLRIAQIAQTPRAKTNRSRDNEQCGTSRERGMAAIFARLGTFDSVAVAAEAGIWRESAAVWIRRFRDKGLLTVEEPWKQNGWRQGSNPARYRWIGGAVTESWGIAQKPAKPKTAREIQRERIVELMQRSGSFCLKDIAEQVHVHVQFVQSVSQSEIANGRLKIVESPRLRSTGNHARFYVPTQYRWIGPASEAISA